MVKHLLEFGYAVFTYKLPTLLAQNGNYHKARQELALMNGWLFVVDHKHHLANLMMISLLLAFPYVWYLLHKNV